MNFTLTLNPIPLGHFSWLIYFLVLAIALYQAPWRILLREKGLQHLYLGSLVLVAFLWQLQAGIDTFVALHFLFATALTLLFYWQLAVIALSLALVGITLTGKASWEMFALNGLVAAVIPCLVSYFWWRLIEWKLPSNYFIFTILGAGFGSLFAMASSGLGVIFITWLYTSGREFAYIAQNFFMIFPLIMPPEAVVNGMLISGLTAYMPDWVRAFDPKKYLDEQ